MRYIFLLILSLVAKVSFGQALISGPNCVIPGTEYQYLISGDWSSDTTVQVCLSGGVIAGTTDSCITDTAISFVTVVWDSSTVNGTVSVTVGNENTTYNVTTTSFLTGGLIDSVGKIQFIYTDSIPINITCSEATGGACTPFYDYQWQQSYDYSTWTDIDGGNTQNLSFSAGLSQTTYFRRVVTETASNTIGYSDFAAIIVNPPPDTTNGGTGFNRSFNIELESAETISPKNHLNDSKIQDQLIYSQQKATKVSNKLNF